MGRDARAPSIDQVRSVQRAAGNSAVQQLLGEPRIAPAGVHPGGAAVVQRLEEAGVWSTPEGYGEVTEVGGARVVLGELLKIVDEYRGTGIDTVAQQAQVIGAALNGQQARLVGSAALTQAQADGLNAASMAFVGFTTNARTAVANALKAGLRGLLNPPDIGEVNDAIGEYLHSLLLTPDEDKLDKAKEFMENVKGISENVKWVADKALLVMNEIESAKKVFEFSEKLERLNGTIDKLITVKRIGRDLLRLSDSLAGADRASPIGGADAVETSVDLAGLIGKPLMAAVPLFGDYWNSYLVPMTTTCCAKLRQLEAMADKINRDQMSDLMSWIPAPGGWRPTPRPPELPATVYSTLNGGRPVFEYLYLTRVGTPPALSAGVSVEIMRHSKMLERVTGSEIELETRTWNPGTWFNRRPADLPGWVAANVVIVWMSFYGGAGLGPS